MREETGLTLTRWRCRGLLTFVWGNMTEFIHLYTADGWQGEMVQGDACKEGVLEWVPKEKVTELPIWEGDKIFFRLRNGDRPYFSLDVYKRQALQGVLKHQLIAGHGAGFLLGGLQAAVEMCIRDSRCCRHAFKDRGVLI